MAFLLELISIAIYGIMLYPLRTWFIFVKDWRKGEKIPVYWHYLWFVCQLPILGVFIHFLPEGANLAAGEGSVVFFGLLLAYIGAGAYQIERKRYVPKENIYYFDKTDGLYVWLLRMLWILPLYIYLFLAYVVNVHPIDFLAYLVVFAFWERIYWRKFWETGHWRKAWLEKRRKSLEDVTPEGLEKIKSIKEGLLLVVVVVIVVSFVLKQSIPDSGSRYGIGSLVAEIISETLFPALAVVIGVFYFLRASRKSQNDPDKPGALMKNGKPGALMKNGKILPILFFTAAFFVAVQEGYLSVYYIPFVLLFFIPIFVLRAGFTFFDDLKKDKKKPLWARLLFLIFLLPCIPLLVSFVYPISFNPVLSMLEEGNYTFLFLASGAALIYYRAGKRGRR